MTQTKLVEKIFEKPCITLSNTLDGVFQFVFSPILKYQIKKESELQKYKEQIYNNVSSIPQENLVEPPLNIVGPALEASKFYIDADEIRNMFAKLISSSMDSRINRSAHPSFIEIIKQLSPLDAETLTLFKNSNILPISKLRVQNSSGEGYDHAIHILDNKYDNIDLVSLSISNLIRLGLVDVSYTTSLTDKTKYLKFNNHPLLLEVQGDLDMYISYNKLTDIRTYQPVMINGVMTLTPIGLNFIKVCL